MSRRSRADKRETAPDPKFESRIVTKFINALMYDGKKSIAERIFYDAIDLLEERSGQPGLQAFEHLNVGRRVGARRARGNRIVRRHESGNWMMKTLDANGGTRHFCT